MERHLIKITPTSELLFRDGTSMDMRTSNWIISKTIPNLSVLYGALISMQLRNGNWEKVKELIESNKKGEEEKQNEIDEKLREYICIKGIYLTDGKKLYMPAPLDLFYSGEKIEQGEFVQVEGETVLHLPKKMFDDDKEWEKVSNKYISIEDYKRYYVNGKVRNIKLVKEEDFFSFYHKVGLEIGTNRTVEKGKLYFADMVTFKNKEMGYVVEVECKNNNIFDTKQLILLGGERKTAIVEKYLKEKSLPKVKEKIGKETKIKLVLTAPFQLSDQEIFDSGRVEIISSVIGTTEYIGGYSLAIDKQKKMRETIPAGSVFILKINKKYNKLEEYLENEYFMEGNLEKYLEESFRIEKTDKIFRSFEIVIMPEDKNN